MDTFQVLATSGAEAVLGLMNPSSMTRLSSDVANAPELLIAHHLDALAPDLGCIGAQLFAGASTPFVFSSEEKFLRVGKVVGMGCYFDCENHHQANAPARNPARSCHNRWRR